MIKVGLSWLPLKFGRSEKANLVQSIDTSLGTPMNRKILSKIEQCHTNLIFFVILEYVIEMKNEMKLMEAILRICANQSAD